MAKSKKLKKVRKVKLEHNKKKNKNDAHAKKKGDENAESSSPSSASEDERSEKQVEDKVSKKDKQEKNKKERKEQKKSKKNKALELNDKDLPPPPTVMTKKFIFDHDEDLSVIKGLYNLGNTCFFNSVLQSLAHTFPLVAHFVDLKEVFKERASLPTETHKPFCGTMTCALWLFFAQMYQHPMDSLNPVILLKEIIKKAPRFRGYQQQDAQELLRYLQDICREEILASQKEVQPEEQSTELEHSGESPRPVAAELLKPEEVLVEHEEKPIEMAQKQEQQLWVPKVPEPRKLNNVIDRSFGALLCSSVLCHHCGNISRRFEEALDISVPIPRQPEPNGRKLGELFALLEKSELQIHSKNDCEVLNPQTISSYCSKLVGDSKTATSLGHCLWGFARCELLSTKEQNGYTCDRCSRAEEEGVKEEQTKQDKEEPLDRQQQDTGAAATTQDEKKSQEPENNKEPTGDNLITNGDSTSAGERKQSEGASREEKATEVDVQKTEQVSELASGAQAVEPLPNEIRAESEEAVQGSNNEKNEEQSTEEKDKKRHVYRDASRQISFWEPPEILTIHLKRFVREEERVYRKKKRSSFYSFLDNGGGYVKNQEDIHIPFTLELDPFVHPASPFAKRENKYSLYAVVEHQGEMNFGHYVAFVKRLKIDHSGQRKRGKWYHVSDSQVKEVSAANVQQAEGYLLFYERIHHDGL